jgi:hypothetical protein
MEEDIAASYDISNLSSNYYNESELSHSLRKKIGEGSDNRKHILTQMRIDEICRMAIIKKRDSRNDRNRFNLKTFFDTHCEPEKGISSAALNKAFLKRFFNYNLYRYSASSLHSNRKRWNLKSINSLELMQPQDEDISKHEKGTPHNVKEKRKRIEKEKAKKKKERRKKPPSSHNQSLSTYQKRKKTNKTNLPSQKKPTTLTQKHTNDTVAWYRGGKVCHGSQPTESLLSKGNNLISYDPTDPKNRSLNQHKK